MDVGLTTDIANKLHTISALAVADTPIKTRLQDLLTNVSELLTIPCAALFIVENFPLSPKYNVAGANAQLVQKLQVLPSTEGGAKYIEQFLTTNEPFFFSKDFPSQSAFLNSLESGLEGVAVLLSIGKRRLGTLAFLTPDAVAFYNEKKSLLNIISEQITLLLPLLNPALAEATKDSQPTIKGLIAGEALAMLSHELRTPLNSILGWVSLLQNPTTDKKLWQQALDTIERSARAQNQIINELLDASYSFNEQLLLNSCPVLIHTIIRQVVATLRPDAELKGVTLNALIEPGNEYVLADPERLSQVIWHLLSNAIKFTPKEGNIQLQVARKNTEIEITLSDSGIGIAPEFLPYIFDPFRQEESKTTRKFGGLGLGLSIVRHQVELHGGVIEAKSAGKNLGTTFTIRLPLLPRQSLKQDTSYEVRQTSVSASTTSNKSLSGKNLHGVRVLVVDDDADSLEQVSTILNGCNAKVQTASSADEALTILEHWKPDILISDLQMPDIDGYELIRRIRHQEIQFHQRMAAIALTAYTRAEDRLRVLASGFQTHLPKPIVPAELVAVVNSFAIKPSEKMSLC